MNRRDITVVYGSDIIPMTTQLLEAIDLAGDIGSKSARIGLKPNLVVGREASGGATTHPEIAQGIIIYLQRHGFANITILEGSWVGAATGPAFDRCGYTALSQQYGVALVDTKRDKTVPLSHGGLTIDVCKSALDCDYLINLPVLKGHCQTTVTCALKNMKGIIPDSEKRRFHTMGLHKPIAVLNKMLAPALNIVDAMCGDLDFEEGGNPVIMNRLFACKDSVLTDAYACYLMGYDTSEVSYIGLAQQLGVGTADIGEADIRELNEPDKSTTFAPSRKAKSLARYVDDIDACSACYGSLIHALARLEDKGLLHRINDKILIGQGYQGQSRDAIGIGRCTSGCSKSLGGCPPSAKAIVEFLEQNL